MRTRAARVLAEAAFWLAAAIAAVLLAVLVLAAAGVLPVEAAERRTVPAARATPPPEPEPAARPPERAREMEPTRTTAPAPDRVTVTVAASRGDSWISARLGSATGRVLEERLLPQGETARLTGPRVWLLVGASANIDVTVDGVPQELAPGTVETVFGPPVR